MSTEIANPLNSLERSSLRRCEKVVDKGCQAFLAVGTALLEIRDGKLHRETHKSFSAFCEERWGMGKSHAYRLIDAASVQQKLSPIGDVLPIAESQTRPLMQLPEEQQAPAWADAVDAAGGEQPTAAQVQEVVDTYLADNEPPDTGDAEPAEEGGVMDAEDEAPAPAPDTAWNNTVDAWAKSLRQVGKAVKAHPNPWAEECCNIFTAELKTAIGCLKAVKAAGPCSYCNGEGCKQCLDTGYLPKQQLDAAPPK